MNYTEVKQLALQYADRTDADVVDNIDMFLRITESRINKDLKIRQQFKRAVIETKADQLYYGLPSDFAELRDIEFRATVESTVPTTPTYLNPEQMNDLMASSGSTCAYAIIANQIQVWPASDKQVFEIVYASKLVPLSDATQETWLSIDSPEVYIFGLLVEISSYVKDGTAAQLWEQRFQQGLSALTSQDWNSRWSGNPLTIKVDSA